MAIVTVSRGTLSGGRRLAADIAERLRYSLVHREELMGQAKALNVPVDALEAAMGRPPRVRQQLELERDRYLTAMTMLLCTAAGPGRLVYSGHSGHMLLSGVPGVMRVRVLAGSDYRVHAGQRELGLSRAAAREYVVLADERRDRWVKFLYGVDWHDPFHYDVVINLDQVGELNAADMIASAAEARFGDDAQVTAQVLADLRLAAQVKLALLSDDRTSTAGLQVRSLGGRVFVMCPSRDAGRLAAIETVAASTEGVESVKCAVADSIITLIGERFRAEDPAVSKLCDIAVRRRAAIELLVMGPLGYETAPPLFVGDESSLGQMTSHEFGDAQTSSGYACTERLSRSRVGEMVTKLEQSNLTAGASIFCGPVRSVLPALRQRASCRMLVLGDLFVERNEEVRQRLLDETKAYLSENTRIPVAHLGEIVVESRLNLRDFSRMLVSLVLAAAIFMPVMWLQGPGLETLQIETGLERNLVLTALVLIAVPVFAFVYGNGVRLLLRIMHLE
jgi:cytidylate kinase